MLYVNIERAIESSLEDLMFYLSILSRERNGIKQRRVKVRKSV